MGVEGGINFHISLGGLLVVQGDFLLAKGKWAQLLLKQNLWAQDYGCLQLPKMLPVEPKSISRFFQSKDCLLLLLFVLNPPLSFSYI